MRSSTYDFFSADVSVFVCVSFMYAFFFFQAEDGIRDLVRSRGLGDVYKRQIDDLSRLVVMACKEEHKGTYLATGEEVSIDRLMTSTFTVSYTHLTLPTIYSV